LLARAGHRANRAAAQVLKGEEGGATTTIRVSAGGNNIETTRYALGTPIGTYLAVGGVSGRGDLDGKALRGGGKGGGGGGFDSDLGRPPTHTHTQHLNLGHVALLQRQENLHVDVALDEVALAPSLQTPRKRKLANCHTRHATCRRGSQGRILTLVSSPADTAVTHVTTASRPQNAPRGGRGPSRW
jgi:hypothetical protein